MWIVRDGTSIQIWNYRWLPTPIFYSAQSPPRVIPEGSIVFMLIDPKLRGWNSSLIHTIFSKEEAEVIVTIPLSPTFPSDQLAWNGTSNGIFSVRSAYHMRMEIQEHNQGSTSQEGSGHWVWSFIWRSQIQPSFSYGMHTMTYSPQGAIWPDENLWKIMFALAVWEM